MIQSPARLRNNMVNGCNRDEDTFQRIVYTIKDKIQTKTQRLSYKWHHLKINEAKVLLTNFWVIQKSVQFAIILIRKQVILLKHKQNSSIHKSIKSSIKELQQNFYTIVHSKLQNVYRLTMFLYNE